MEFQRVGNKELNTLDIEEKLDLGWLVKYKLEDMDTARTQRLAALAMAAAANEEARRLAREKGRLEREARLKEILVKHPDRWIVSIDNKRIVPGKKAISFSCPKCGAELPLILQSLGDAMGGTFERMGIGDFSNGSGHARIVVSDLNCSKCKEHLTYRCLPLPF
jgi:hypothetical protein